MNLFLCNFLSEWKEFVQVYFEFCWNAVSLEREQRKERRGKLRGEGGREAAHPLRLTTKRKKMQRTLRESRNEGKRVIDSCAKKYINFIAGMEGIVARYTPRYTQRSNRDNINLCAAGGQHTRNTRHNVAACSRWQIKLSNPDSCKCSFNF